MCLPISGRRSNNVSMFIYQGNVCMAICNRRKWITVENINGNFVMMRCRRDEVQLIEDGLAPARILKLGIVQRFELLLEFSNHLVRSPILLLQLPFLFCVPTERNQNQVCN